MTRTRALAGTIAVLTFLAGVVVLGPDRAHQAPRVRLHGGSAWLASNKVGQLTLLDGSSAEVAARVSVAAPGSPMRAAQLGPTGYALNRWDGSVVRVDGATLEPSHSATPLATAGDQLTVFPTSHTLYALDSNRGLLAPVDPATLDLRGSPFPLAAQVTPDGSAVDGDGRLWALDQRTGDLVWFSADVQHERAHAGTPQRTRLTLTDGRPALLDLARRTAELLDPETGAVVESVRVDLRPDDTVTMSGSPQQRRLLISVGSRGALMVCTFGADACPLIPLGPGADLGAAIEANDHAVVPDYSTGRVWIVNLVTMRVVVERQLFNRPVRFELLTRDGVIFYNDPDSDQAGVLDLDGRVRAAAKYDAAQPDKVYPTQASDSGDKSRQPPAPPNSGSPDEVPPVAVPGSPDDPGPGQPGLAIVVKPRDRGKVGDEFELSVVAPGVATARWTFGDGAEAFGTTVRHRWNQPGEFAVNVAATLTNGRRAPVATAVITVEPATALPRITALNVRPETPQTGRPVWISASLTGGRADRWEWSLNGETRSDRPEFQHTFTTPGTYTLTLAVFAGTTRIQQSRQITVVPTPPSVRCGDVLTASATLTADLVCPNNVAVTVAAGDVVLDLGGHTITTQAHTATGAGILVRGASSVTIRNGRVTQFRHGIRLTGTTGVTVSNVTSSSSSSEDNGADIFGDRARDVQLRNVVLTGSVAFVFDQGSSATITDSTVSYHAPTLRPVSRGKCIHNSSCTVVKSNLRMSYLLCQTFTGDLTSSIAIDNSDVEVDRTGSECDSATIRNSRVLPGYLESGRAVVFSDNTVTLGTNPDGRQFGIGSNRTFDVSGNSFSGMDKGLTLGYGTGRVTGNRFTENSETGLTLYLYQGGPVEISGNTFRANGRGLAGRPDLPHGGLIVDRANTENRLVTITGNRTMDNTGHGIWAPGKNIVDGGGNTSTNDEMDCHGVKCN